MENIHQQKANVLLGNPKFMNLFRKSMENEPIPSEDDPKREKWLEKMQQQLWEEMNQNLKQELEVVHSDADGQWMWILPKPGFCVKARTSSNSKIFINICQHERIREAMPMNESELASSSVDSPDRTPLSVENNIAYRIPLSCGVAKPGKDNAGKPCKIYDVAVNPRTVERCGKDSDFRRFVVALCLSWISQKNEPTLNTEKFINLNISVKGSLEMQRIRLSSKSAPSNAFGDEILLPSHENASSGSKNSITDKPLIVECNSNDASKKVSVSSKVLSIKFVGQYDWSKNQYPAKNSYFRENVPEALEIELHLPTVEAATAIDMELESRRTNVFQLDEEGERAFLLCVELPFPVDVDEGAINAEFFRTKKVLRFKLFILLADGPIQGSPNVVDEEEKINEEYQKDFEIRLNERKELLRRQSEEAESVLAQRKAMTSDLVAAQSGMIPPSLFQELEKFDKVELGAVLWRIEHKISRNDSIDHIFQKFPPTALTELSLWIRKRLGLEVPEKISSSRSITLSEDKLPHFSEKLKVSNVINDDNKSNLIEDDSTSGDRNDNKIYTRLLSDEESITSIYNAVEKSKKLFGVEFHNRYLFSIDL